MCPLLFHKIPQAIQDEVKQAFHLPFDRIAQYLMDELAWFLFFLLPRWCLHYTQGGHIDQQKVSTRIKRFMTSNWSSF
jgi:hypothetical protein